MFYSITPALLNLELQAPAHIQSLLAQSDAPLCLYGASPMGDVEPYDYCQCGKNYATFYPVVSGTSNPCPYTEPLPTSTLTFKKNGPTPDPEPTPNPTIHPTPVTSGVVGQPSLGPITNYPDGQCKGLDIIDSLVQDAVNAFCAKYNNTILHEGDGKQLISDQPDGYYGGRGCFSCNPIWYKITASWIPSCQMAPQNINNPIPGENCFDVFYSCWRNAIGNAGRGGYRTAGCLDVSLKVQCAEDS